MQRTANLITALTALALAVAFVAGLSFQAQRTDAAAATIAALNVGTCHTTDSAVLDKDDCNDHYQTFEFNRQGLENAVEVDSLYATYAHDPKTADEPPRGILKDADLVKISIKDEGRDVRSGVLLISSNVAEATVDSGSRLSLSTVVDATLDDPPTPSPTPATEGPVTQLGGVVAAAIDGYTFNNETMNVPTVETGFTFKRTDEDSATGPVQITVPGIVELLFEPVGGTVTYKPIARGRDRGEMRFFGMVENGGADDDLATAADNVVVIRFGALDDYLDWDEDVVSGSDENAPAISLQANLGGNERITLRAIHYLTSQVEYMIGGERCVPGEGIPDDDSTPADESVAKGTQAACTDDELGDEPAEYDNFKLDVSSDGVQASRNVYLRETGRFTGVFQGWVRLTDSDGDGGNIGTDGERVMTGDNQATRLNWGRVVKHAEDHADQDANAIIEADAAVIGVDNGPVRITYKDTDGVTRTFSIMIDIGPPIIDVTSPTHNGRSDDEEINFSGSINDGESGLAEDSFALYVDHENDAADEQPGSLNLPVDSTVLEGGVDADDDLGDVVADSEQATGGVIATEVQYAGYGPMKQTYGVINSVLIYPMNDPAAHEVTSDDDENNRKGIEAESFSDGDSDATFRDSIRINFLQSSTDNEPYNHAIDFHAVVRDTAGNVGFSDSDEANPRYINDLGTKLADRLGTEGKGALPNVLGVFSRHVVYIDNVDPVIDGDKTVTGFYDVDGDGDPVVDRAGVMVVFDGPIDSRSVSAGTFLLSLGEGDDAESLNIIEAKVSGKLAFLKLDQSLESNAKPKLTIAQGEEVRDLAGRVTRSDEQDEVEVNDGNLPVFTVTLSDGSGLGTDGESSSRLTNNTIKVSITSDEDIQGAPKVAVVCSNLIYPGATDTADDRSLTDYVNELSGATKDPVLGQITAPDCGTIDASVDRTLRTASSLSRGDNQWEYTWRQYDGDARVPDGLATVVVWGNDRSQYEKYDSDDTIRNWGSSSSEFRFDSNFESPLNENSGGRVLPAEDSDVAERRPFVLLDFSGEPTTVTVTELMVDGTDVTASLDTRGQNQFLYWPETLSSGEHEVKFSARDAANNKVENQSFKFEVTSRDPFVLSLFAGWNAISFPADPKANTLDDIFGESAVDRVIGWIPSSTTGPWAIATKADGVWMSSIDTANLDKMTAQYGYWVHSTAFVDVSVELQGPIDRETGDVPLLTGVPTYPGWNFVGVVDQDGDQTEGRAGSNLKDGIVNVAGEANVGQQDDIEVKDYLSGFARAYRWDVITNSYQVLTGSDNLKIGEGIWVYFDAGIAP